MSTALEALAPPATVVVPWERNKHNPDSVKSNRTNLGKTKKIILPAPKYKGPMPRPGEEWVCQVDDISKPKSEDHGAIYVIPVEPHVSYHFPSVWIPEKKVKLITCILQDPKRHLMMHGEAGVGKSTIAEAIATGMKWNFRKISCGAIQKAVYMLGRFIPYSDGNPIDFGTIDENILDSLRKYEPGTDGSNKLSFGQMDDRLMALLARYVLSSNNKQLSFKYAESKLVAVAKEAALDQDHTYLSMFDEFTRMHTDARDILLDIIEGKQRFLRLVTGEEIPIRRNFKFMAAGNVGEGFTIKQSDAAQDDRWEIIKITVMPPEQELAHCLRLYPACPKKTMDIAIKAITKVREARKDVNQQLSKTVSTRRAEATAMYLSKGIDIVDALEAAVANQYEGDVEDLNSQAYKVLNILKDAVAAEK